MWILAWILAWIFGVDFGPVQHCYKAKIKIHAPNRAPPKTHSIFHTGFRACFRASFRRGFRPSFRPEKPKIHDTFLSCGCRELCLEIWPEFACSSDMENARACLCNSFHLLWVGWGAPSNTCCSCYTLSV